MLARFNRVKKLAVFAGLHRHLRDRTPCRAAAWQLFPSVQKRSLRIAVNSSSFAVLFCSRANRKS